MSIKLKRIYEETTKEDKTRILVDRIWPRGISKEKAKLDYWLKDIGPSNKLRKSFHDDELTFKQFKERYVKELNTGDQKDELDKLKEIADEQNQITLLFATKNEEENQAVILKEILEK